MTATVYSIVHSVSHVKRGGMKRKLFFYDWHLRSTTAYRPRWGFLSVLSCNPSCYSLVSVPYDSSLLKTSPGLCARCYKLLILLIDLRISGCNISNSFYCVTTQCKGYDSCMFFFPSNFTVLYLVLLFLTSMVPILPRSSLYHKGTHRCVILSVCSLRVW